MSNQRKSFILYKDSLSVLDDLNDEQVAGLFRAIKEYQLTGEVQLTGLLKIAFSPFKAQFSRDDEKYIKTCEARASAGSKGGKQKVANASKSKQKVAKLADSVNGSGSVNESVNGSGKEVTNDRFAEFWDLYGKKTDSSKCKAKFSKLTSTEIVLVFTNLPLYIKSTPDKQYRKNPITWLNGKCWNDEIMQQVGQAQSVHTFEHQNYQSGKF